ncbi:MAG: carbohydrate ABC transporter permease [Treponema sp.]|nr:carbohydrate ABC transporter permease [Treponema sp.]
MKLPTTKIAAFVFLLFMGLLFLHPILWIFISSFKVETEIQQAGGFLLLPETWTLANFATILDVRNVQTPVFTWFANSAFVSGVTSILAVLIVSMSAYAFSKLQFRGRDVLFLTILFVSSFPAIVTIVPLYRVVLNFGLLNTPWALIFPWLVGVFNIFLVKQFMRGIPDTIIDAAKIDGAGEFRIYARIMLPLTKPILTIVGIFSFTASWNDFLWPGIVMKEIRTLTLTVGLQLAQGTYEQHLSLMSAISVIAVIPMIVLYVCAERFFVRGVSISAGVKG